MSVPTVSSSTGSLKNSVADLRHTALTVNQSMQKELAGASKKVQSAFLLSTVR